MKIIRRYFLSLIIVIMAFALGKYKENLKDIFLHDKTHLNLVNKKIYLPDSLIRMETRDFVDVNKLSAGKAKVVYFFNAECGACLVKLSQWESFYEKYNASPDLNFIFIAWAPTINILNYLIKGAAGVNIPVFYDHDSLFYKYNNESIGKDILKPMLLNEKNEIILIGSPVNNRSLMTAYEERIKKLISENRRDVFK